MAVRIDGKAVAAKVRGEIAEEVAALKKLSRLPYLFEIASIIIQPSINFVGVILIS